MKKLIYLIGVILAAGVVASCGSDDDENTWETYAEWREENKTWYAAQADKLDEDGNPFYEKVVPAWAPDKSILVHWFNDRAETRNNLVPLYKSTIEACYIGYLCNGTPVDSSYTNPDGVFTSRVSGLVEGWQIALMNMHVGDSVQIVMPYSLGYGSTATGEILPYSALRFNFRLTDIPFYETRP